MTISRGYLLEICLFKKNLLENLLKRDKDYLKSPWFTEIESRRCFRETSMLVCHPFPNRKIKEVLESGKQGTTPAKKSPDRQGTEPGFSAWKRDMLTTTPLRQDACWSLEICFSHFLSTYSIIHQYCTNTSLKYTWNLLEISLNLKIFLKPCLNFVWQFQGDRLKSAWNSQISLNYLLEILFWLLDFKWPPWFSYAHLNWPCYPLDFYQHLLEIKMAPAWNFFQEVTCFKQACLKAILGTSRSYLF